MKTKIVDIHPADGFYSDRETLIGLEGEWKGSLRGKDFVSGMFILSKESKESPRMVIYSYENNDNKLIDHFYFYKVSLTKTNWITKLINRIAKREVSK